MSTPTAEQLLDYNLQFDNALTAVFAPLLAPANIPFVTYQQPDAEDNVPRLEGLFIMGSGNNYLMKLPSLPQGYSAQFLFNSFTRRTESQPPTPMLGIIRNAFNPQTSILDTKLDWLQILSIEEVSSFRRVNTDGGNKTDECGIAYHFTFCIKQEFQSLLVVP